ncbi:hypothetical protein Mal4_52110 [Maioricimonas rarisocia]|uniref:Uncharacterized protein n=1 Tax=Maioricimonas rarisocia TaxID=2528026 RepID=A0A517ZEF9_9PLAN|nr:hypothetical protein [Maioricimonas rarisocia]QDU40848.1 hypothetical protein Mal4_52110 [Maioricimonas rarisocia]
MTADTTKARFRKAVLAVGNAQAGTSGVDLDALQATFREALLLFGSQTADNLAGVDQIVSRSDAALFTIRMTS